MWAAPRSAAAAAVAREGSGPGRTGPGWSRSGGRPHRRPRERATQRRTEPPPSPLRPGPGGCAAPSRCLRRRSRSRSGHRAGEARRGEAGRGAAGWPGGGRGGGSFWGPIGPRPGPAPSAAFSSSPSLCRLCLRLHPSWDVGLHSLGRIPRPGTAPRRPHLPTLSSLCSGGCCPPLLCQSRSLWLHSPGTPDSPLRCLHDPSPLSPVPRFLPAASLPTSSPLNCAREPLS